MHCGVNLFKSEEELLFGSDIGTSHTCCGEILELNAITLVEIDYHIAVIQKYSIDSKCWSFDMKQYINLIAGNTILYAQWERDFDATIAYACSTPLGIGRYINSPLVIDTYNGLGSFIIQSPDDITYKGYNNCSWYKNVVSHSPIYSQQ